MNKEEFIGKLQMVYVGDRNAIEEIISEYDRLNNIIDELEKELDKGFEVYICNGRKTGKSIELGYKICQKEILNKLNQLKGDNK